MAKTNIVLTGFMYSGKSTIGELVARSTGRRLLDTDEMIERETGSTVSDIFAGHGEGAFREMERSVVGEAVVALVVAGAAQEKFGGDSLGEMRRNVSGYLEQISARWRPRGDA